MQFFSSISLIFLHMLFARITRALINHPEIKIDACPELEGISTNLVEPSYPTCLNHWEPLFHDNLLAEMFQLNNPNLVIILSENSNDAMKLARNFTNNNKLLPQKKREMFANNMKSHYDFIVENFIAYENQNQSMIFLVYPRNTDDEFLAQEIVIQSVRYATTVQLILTLSDIHGKKINKDDDIHQERKNRVRGIFEIAGKMIKNVSKYNGSYLLIVTGDGNTEIDQLNLENLKENVKSEKGYQGAERNIRTREIVEDDPEKSRTKFRTNRKSNRRFRKKGGRMRRKGRIDRTSKFMEKIIREVQGARKDFRKTKKNFGAINGEVASIAREKSTKRLRDTSEGLGSIEKLEETKRKIPNTSEGLGPNEKPEETNRKILKSKEEPATDLSERETTEKIPIELGSNGGFPKPSGNTPRVNGSLPQNENHQEGNAMLPKVTKEPKGEKDIQEVNVQSNSDERLPKENTKAKKNNTQELEYHERVKVSNRKILKIIGKLEELRTKFKEPIKDTRSDYIHLISDYAEAPNGNPNGRLLAKMIDQQNVVSGDTDHGKLLEYLSKLKRVPANTYDYESQMHRFLKCLFNSSNMDLTFAVESLVSRIRTKLHSENFVSGMTTLTSVFTLTESLNTAHEALSTFLNCVLGNVKNFFNKCSDKLVQDLKPLGLDLIDIDSIKENFSIYCWAGHIFKAMDTEYNNKTQEWITIIENYLQDLKYPRNWFRSLRTIFDDLEPRKDSLSIGDIELQLDELFKEVTNHVGYNVAFMMNAARIVKEDLRKVRVNVECQRESVVKLKVTGEFLRLSQILNDTVCPNFKILEIFALEKIVIDCDLVAIGEEILVAIFAPVWEIVMNRRIILDGASRNLTDDDYMEPKGRNGNTLTNRNGVHGLAGLPGGPAGAFYGLAEEIINAENLTISLNGGNGSNGQNGGDGANGEDGETPGWKYIHSMFNYYACKWLNDYQVDYKVNKSSIEKYYRPLFSSSYFLKYQSECYIFGLNGSPGGNGGDGGTIGKGGAAGDFHFHSLTSPILPVVSAKNGSDGRCGIGGKKGLGGYTRKVVIYNQDYFEHKITNNETVYRATDGNVGKDNTSTLGIKIQKVSEVEQTFPQTVNLYKRYILTNFDTDWKYVKFYEKMISNQGIINTYDTMALVSELIDMEKYYFRVDDKKKTLFIYKSWRERLITYSSNRKDSEKTEEYTALHRNLHRIISDKIQRLETDSNERLIFMLADYYNQCEELLKHLENARTVLRIKEINSKFIKDYDDKVKEAQQIIQEKLLKDIEEMNLNLKGETEMLLRRISSLTERERKNTEELSEKSKAMESRLGAKAINEIFELLNSVLGVINPALGQIGTKISTAGSIVQNFIDETADSSIVECTIPKVVDRSREFFNNWVDIKSEIEQMSLERSLDLLASKKHELLQQGNNVEPLESLSSSLAGLKNLGAGDIPKELDDRLTREKTIWEKLNLGKKQIYNGALKAIEQIRTFTRMKQMLGELSDKFDDVRNQRHLNELNGEIHKAFQKTINLRNFKEEVYRKMIPLIRKIRDETSLSGNMTESSIAYLDFKKFQMKEYFQQVLEQLEIFISQFNLETLFSTTMKNMRNVIDMVLSTYERIQEYVDTMKKANYESDLYLAPFDLIYIRNPQLSIILAKMVQTINANNVLDNYNKWMTSFKQYIFPFADEFLAHDSQFLTELTGILAKAEDAGKRLRHLGEKLFRKRAEFGEFEKTYPGKFGSNLPPFHIWKNSSYQVEINRILQGETVTLQADIFDHKIMNAVKFRDIWLRLDSNDPNLKNDLRGFAFKLIHQGDSYYRCDNEVYLISSNSYPFEKVYVDEDEFRENDDNCGGVLSGKQRGDYLLSPYATWTIRLISRDADKKFDMLRKYHSKVNLELVGLGQYTDRYLEICGSNLTKYYEKLA